MSQPAVELAEALPSFGDKYEVERVIGRGGMGTVFEARHTRLGQRVALKVLAPELRAYPELVARFEREARAASALSSPHAARVFDIDTADDGAPFMVMELLSGCDLARRLDDEGPQPIGRAVRWIVQACNALAEAHRLGIVHRDIKPSNLLLCANGRIKVLDFGIAKQSAPRPGECESVITNATTPLGTPQYMSPEQVRCAKDVDARTDIWALGITLFELVCGSSPFDHAQPAACIAAVAADPVPDPRVLRPDMPDDLAEAILEALAKDPDDRFQSVEELVMALLPHADPEPADDTLDGFAAVTHSRHPPTDATLDDAAIELQGSPTPAPRARDGRRARSIAGLATAVMCGLGVFLGTPQHPRSQLDARSTGDRSSVAPPIATAAPPSVSAVVPPLDNVDAGLPMSAEPEPPAPKRPMRPSRRAPVRGHLVHGGLSTPGF